MWKEGGLKQVQGDAAVEERSGGDIQEVEGSDG